VSIHPVPIIELAPGAAESGFAPMLAQLVRQNLDDDPAKREAFPAVVGRVAILVVDMHIAVTLQFAGGKLVVHDGIHGVPDLVVRAPADIVMRLSLLETGRFGLPDPRGEVAKDLIRGLRDGSVRIHGLPFALPLLARFSNLLAVAPPKAA
jgi:hypothetical protein